MLKFLLNIVFLLILTSANSQSNSDFYSVYFSNPKIEGYETSATFPASWNGTYLLNKAAGNEIRQASGDKLIIDASGICIERNKIIGISREEVRENSKYTVRDGYLHGVLENDSLAVVLDGENYYFFMPSKTYLFASNGSQSIYHVVKNSKILVFSAESNALYSPLLIQFNAGKLELLELNYPTAQFDFSKVAKSTELPGDYPTYVIDPNKEEWSKILTCFAIYDTYQQQNK